MKYLFALIFIILGPRVGAEPLPPQAVSNMVDQIGYVMDQRLCAVANDTRDYGTQTMLVLLPAPVGRRLILVNDYNWFRNTGYTPGVQHKYLMQDRAEACSVDALSGRCLAMRSYFSQLPLADHPPGPGVKAFQR